MCAALVCAHGLERTVDLTKAIAVVVVFTFIHFYRVLNSLPQTTMFPPHHFILIPNLPPPPPFSSRRQRCPLGGGRRGRGRQQRPLLHPGRRVQPGRWRRSGRHGRRRGEPRRDGGDRGVRGVRVEGQQHRRGRGKRERCVDRKLKSSHKGTRIIQNFKSLFYL